MMVDAFGTIVDAFGVTLDLLSLLHSRMQLTMLSHGDLGDLARNVGQIDLPILLDLREEGLIEFRVLSH